MLPSVDPYKRSQQGEPSNPPSVASPTQSQSDSNYDSLVYRVRVPTKATRRIRGEIACAECRRLKIRCDKNVPCSTCIKRGCSALCPNGTIPPGDGSRFVLAATDHLHKKITAMEARMRSLEDALAIINSATSDTPHPLLTTPLVDSDNEQAETLLNFPPEPQPDRHEISALADSLGTLLLDSNGGTRFFGPSGGSEGLLLKFDKGDTSSNPANPPLQELDPSYLPPEINQCYQCFPFTPPGIIPSAIQKTIESFLPPIERAIALCDTFLEHLSWMFSIVTRHQLVKELIPVIYKQVKMPYGPHDLALLLIVFGIGCLVDLNLQPYNMEAQHYYRLARATLTLQPVLGKQSIITVKVLHLMSIYNGMSGKESNLEQCYVLLDLASQVALRIGFHIDPSMWGFEGREAYDRRSYFWNLMAGVLWQSLVTGRPPALLTSFIDCRIPSPHDEQLFQQGEVPVGFGIWGFKASSECLIPLAKTTLAAKPPNYSAIMELDSKIRNLVQPLSDSSEDERRTAISMRAFVRSHYQDLMLLFLHRGYFAQAMSEYPTNPLNSPYGRSVFAAYTSACNVLQDTRAQFSKNPLLCGRIWRLWSFSFSAAVVVGTVAIRGVHLNLKPSPLEEFRLVCEVFRKAADTSSRAARALPVLTIMLEKAYQARDYYHGQGRLAVSDANADDDLSLFGGRTRVISQEAQCASQQQLPHPILPASALPETAGKTPAIGPTNSQLGESSNTLPRSPSSSPGYTFSDDRSPLSQPIQPLSLPHIPNIRSTASGDSRSTPHPTSIGELTGGWDGLFDEVHRTPYQPRYSHSGPQQPVTEGTTLNDRWSSFIQNYSILEPTRYENERL